jgi:hypothetical protein
VLSSLCGTIVGWYVAIGWAAARTSAGKINKTKPKPALDKKKKSNTVGNQTSIRASLLQSELLGGGGGGKKGKNIFSDSPPNQLLLLSPTAAME